MHCRHRSGHSKNFVGAFRTDFFSGGPLKDPPDAFLRLENQMNAVVEVRNLWKQFERKERTPGIRGLLRSWVTSNRASPIDAVKDLSFSMEEGESMAFI